MAIIDTSRKGWTKGVEGVEIVKGVVWQNGKKSLTQEEITNSGLTLYIYNYDRCL